MGHSLYGRLALALVGLLVAVGMVYGLITLQLERHHQQRLEQAFNRDLARRLVEDRHLVQEGRLDRAALKSTFQAYMDINPSIEIYLLDLKGRILAYSADPGKVKRRSVSLAPIRRFLAGDRDYPLLGDDPRSHERRKPFSVTPVPSASAPEGYLYVVLRGEAYERLASEAQAGLLWRLGGGALAASLLFGLLAGLLLFRLLTRRLNRLADTMDAFRRSDFSTACPWPVSPRGDEIDRLGATFNDMARRIGSQLESLRRQDRLRRDLIANVSHDLRTPLAVLQGYLETLRLKWTDMEPAQRDTYLEAALLNSARLSRQMNGLFELAQLEAREPGPTMEPFPLAELAQDVVMKFAPRARELGIGLTCRQEEGLPFVVGDLALVERVLDNLVSNALEHTGNGGRVEVVLATVEEGVRLAVRDDGRGISPEELPYVCERFYRGEGGAVRRGHGGLGLAICRRILELHRSSLQVESQPGEGSCFAFTLRVASSPHHES
ncbi:MAG TPA: HAMP domain-containing histidine kinase [Gammaproteobacteria bacterium]|nr:HAMP domain-containing histidine kinase [Gammaproteobacteria bacterium]